jgi:hypothetical protein
MIERWFEYLLMAFHVRKTENIFSNAMTRMTSSNISKPIKLIDDQHSFGTMFNLFRHWLEISVLFFVILILDKRSNKPPSGKNLEVLFGFLSPRNHRMS